MAVKDSLLATFFSLAMAVAPVPQALAGSGPFEGMSPGMAAVPSLKLDTAVYSLDAGVLQFAFTFVNPSDTVLYLDCQVPPRISLNGGLLLLEFDRSPPPDSGAVDLDAFPPQRVGPRQTFQGQRRLNGKFGDPNSLATFSDLQVRMAFYPERDSGEGTPYLPEKSMITRSQKIHVPRRGKAPPPPKVLKRRVPAPG